MSLSRTGSKTVPNTLSVKMLDSSLKMGKTQIGSFHDCGIISILETSLVLIVETASNQPGIFVVHFQFWSNSEKAVFG